MIWQLDIQANETGCEREECSETADDVDGSFILVE